ncbi:cysteine hydrolase family protein [Enterococcus sp. AZ072]|uniref:cysteine hydrolase family protein n=1 Tax=unclassified Enterococcus TaxID=2608891 RepID=UPI003D27DDB1
MNDSILLAIDIQTTTLAPIIGKRTLINNMNSIIERFHEKNAPIIFVQQIGYGAVSSKVNKRENDFVTRKSRPNAFSSSEFNKVIKTMDRKSVVVIGLMSNACVQHTCKGALAKGYSVTLISDAHDSVIKSLREVYNKRLSKKGVVTLTTEEYLLSK